MTMLKRPVKYADTVADLLSERHRINFSPTDTVPSMVETMYQQGMGAAGVTTADNKFIGLVTEREIVRKVFGSPRFMEKRLDYLSRKDAGNSYKDMTAWEVMIANADALSPKDSIEDARDIISYHGYRYMPVVDNGTFTGVVDARELHEHAYAKSRETLHKKDALLSYLMGGEPYGTGARL